MIAAHPRRTLGISALAGGGALFGMGVLLRAGQVAGLLPPTSMSRWLGSAIFLALSLALFSALLRDVLLRFGARPVEPGPGVRPPAG